MKITDFVNVLIGFTASRYIRLVGGLAGAQKNPRSE